MPLIAQYPNINLLSINLIIIIIILKIINVKIQLYLILEDDISYWYRYIKH